MAHVKSSGSTAQSPQGKRHGKRFGVKKYGQEDVVTGNIIIKQKGAKVKAGRGVGTGRDYSLFALKNGKVKFFTKRGKKFVAVE